MAQTITLFFNVISLYINTLVALRFYRHVGDVIDISVSVSGRGGLEVSRWDIVLYNVD